MFAKIIERDVLFMTVRLHAIKYQIWYLLITLL